MSIHHAKSQLPSLRAVRAVEAAARLGSFTEAASEMNVTQGAVSRQIQELERQLAVQLFVRAGPKLSLTETGRIFAESAGQVLEILRDAVAAAQGHHGASFVTLTMLPSVAAKWLAPRLGSFIDAHPNIDLRVSASRHLVSFEAEEIDAAIRYGKGSWRGLHAELLAEETVFPVYAQDYADKLGLTTPADLLRATLFHADINEDWAAWFRKAGVSTDPMARGPRLGDDAAILQAAIDGQGVALGRSALVADDLAAGRLIAPFDIELKAAYSYWWVMPEQRAASVGLMAVRDWIHAEFSTTVQRPA